MRPLSFSVTPGRRKALEVLVKHGYARESNITGVDGHEIPCIYWQSRAWLDKKGLIVQHRYKRQWIWVLTDAGVELCHELAMAPKQLELFADA